MINRCSELNWLTSHLTSGDRQLLVLYGRRRVGKTTLVTDALATIDADSVYYLCNERGPTHNAQSFATRCAETLDDITPDVDGSIEAFQYLKARTDNLCVVATGDEDQLALSTIFE